jgi:FkbM family methyltransferase
VREGFDPARALHLLDGLRTERLTRVVDVGANPLGPAPYKALRSVVGCSLWGFEPQEAARVALNAAKGPQETYLPYVIGAGGAAELTLTVHSGFNSLLDPCGETIEAIGHFRAEAGVVLQEGVVTQRPDDIAELPDFDLLKIDVQGGEAQVLDGAKRRLPGAAAVITEVAAIPLYEGQPLLDAQISMLRPMGYDLYRFQFFKTLKLRRGATAWMPERLYRSQLCDGDAVFIRGLLTLGKAVTERLKDLAILADTVFSSFDLAVARLDELARRQAVDASLVDRYLHLLPEVAPLQAQG